jgi:hypothetical protein
LPAEGSGIFTAIFRNYVHGCYELSPSDSPVKQSKIDVAATFSCPPSMGRRLNAQTIKYGWRSFLMTCDWIGIIYLALVVYTTSMLLCYLAVPVTNEN